MYEYFDNELKIEDYMPISLLDKLEILDICNTNISDISFLEKNKNIKYLDLSSTTIADFSLISNLNKLEILRVSYTKITDISFLEKNLNLKEISICDCNVKKYKFKRKVKIVK